MQLLCVHILFVILNHPPMACANSISLSQSARWDADASQPNSSVPSCFQLNTKEIHLRSYRTLDVRVRLGAVMDCVAGNSSTSLSGLVSNRDNSWVSQLTADPETEKYAPNKESRQVLTTLY